MLEKNKGGIPIGIGKRTPKRENAAMGNRSRQN